MQYTEYIAMRRYRNIYQKHKNNNNKTNNNNNQEESRAKRRTEDQSRVYKYSIVEPRQSDASTQEK